MLLEFIISLSPCLYRWNKRTPLCFDYLCFPQLGKGTQMRLEGHVRGGMKRTPCDFFFLLFSYLNSLAVPFSSRGVDSWKYAGLQSTFRKLLIFPNWGPGLWLGLGENVPRSWVSCASSRFITVSVTQWQGQESRLLPGAPCWMDLLFSERLSIAGKATEQSFFLLSYTFVWVPKRCWVLEI